MISESSPLLQEPLLIGRDDSDDVLEKRRISSDLRFALKTYSPVIYKSASPCTSSMLKSIVLGSNHMNHVICQLSDEWGEPAETFRKKATMILEEMADNLHLSAIRLLAFILSKVFKRVFRRIRVNTEGIERLKKALSDNPVVLLPNHRSYMDFLILSFVFYTYDLNIPVIAARGLLEIKILSTILRRSGAFYIRREIGTNKLYWAVLSEYVKTMLRMGYAPIEFYVEGARSRSFKSLLPKLGLLNIVTDAFLKKEVADVTLVPISITYERPVDETLHAHDLLGLPKIKESMWALFKARKILGQDFGTSSIHLGEPVSLKALVQGDVNLSQYNLDHRHIPHRPSQEIKAFLHHTGCRMIHLQEENMVISPFVLVATILMQNLSGIELQYLIQQTLRLRYYVLSCGVCIDWPDHMSPEAVVVSSISLHRNIVKIDNGKTMLVQEQQADSSTDKHLMQYAVTVLTCSMYRNQILHIFVRPALAAMALSFTNKTQKEEIFICYSFLQDLFSSEFVFLPGNAKQDFEEACHRLSEWGAVQISKQNIELTETGPLVIFFILSIFQPFLEGYQVVCRYLIEEAGDNVDEKQYFSEVHNYAVSLLSSGRLQSYDLLSRELHKNVLAALLHLNALRKIMIDNQKAFQIHKAMIMDIEKKLDNYVYILRKDKKIF
ncbi:dihydroxyacetone phosphate acyltransferase-like [Erpetoichthys calabaricus]|uniref:dihydroxyacetone phosphate acyltransferase-like n=1 Tax=Erpetoichthys calabaricus TaxID=27687 RepID=UPI0022347277|nr:dihydroxyacetone phosphate acyltransferase-like [Erpetoichthys calabaricus]